MPSGRIVVSAPGRSKCPRTPIDDRVFDTQVGLIVPSICASVHFEQEGSRLKAVEIVRKRRSPVIASLHRALFGLGIVVSSYSVRAESAEIIERVVLERMDGGSVDGDLTDATKAALLPIALG